MQKSRQGGIRRSKDKPLAAHGADQPILHDGIGLGIAVTVSKLQQIDDSRHEEQASEDQDINENRNDERMRCDIAEARIAVAAVFLIADR
jgi:hypothetical protein